MTDIPNNEIMTMMAQQAIESVTLSLAVKAREFAKNIPASVSGRDALEAFANAIESTNERRFPKGPKQ